MRVLVCEDDEVVLKVIRMALDGYDAEVEVAHDGRKGLQLLAENPNFDLIITDIHMPHQNGDDILAEARKHGDRSTPILMISSDSDEDVVRMALRLGVDEFLAKPVNPEMIKQKINKLLRTK